MLRCLLARQCADRARPLLVACLTTSAAEWVCWHHQQQQRQPFSGTSTPPPAGGDASDGRATATKLQVLKCTNASATPVSQAVALMLGRDLIPPQQLADSMGALAEQMRERAASHSSTELSAYAEACRRVGFQHSACFAAIIHQLAPQAASIAADELPSLLWVASSLATATPAQDAGRAAAGAQPQASSSSSSSGEASSSSSSGEASSSSGEASSSGSSGEASSSSGEQASGRRVAVPRNDGVVGSINSARLAGLPHVLEFVVGASQVLAGDLDALAGDELPVVADALASIEYRDPFLLTVLAESVLERRHELSEGELLALLDSFSRMGNWFHDSHVLNQLTDELLAGIHHPHKALQQHLAGAAGGGA